MGALVYILDDSPRDADRGQRRMGNFILTIPTSRPPAVSRVHPLSSFPGQSDSTLGGTHLKDTGTCLSRYRRGMAYHSESGRSNPARAGIPGAEESRRSRGIAKAVDTTLTSPRPSPTLSIS